MPHMDEGRMQDWLDGRRGSLTEAERGEIGAHIAACDRCAARLEELRAENRATGDLLGTMGTTETPIPDFSEILARSRTLDDAEGGASTRPEMKPVRPTRRRIPLRSAASIVLAIGVGWMANEVVRTEPEIVTPRGRATAPLAEPRPAAGRAPGTADAAGSGATDPGDDTAPVSPPEQAAAAPPPVVEVPPQRDAGVAPAPAGVDLPRSGAELQRARVALDAGPRADTTWVNGRVTSVDGRPLREAVVSVAETGNAVLSGPDGRFRLGIPTDSVGPDLELRATLLGFAGANRALPVGSGELTIDDLRMEARAVQLEGLVVSGTAIASQRREIDLETRVRIDGTELWSRVGPGYAEGVLGVRPLHLGGIRWTAIWALEGRGAAVIRVTHMTPTGEVVMLYQSRAGLELGPGEGELQATRITESGLHLLAAGPIERDRLVELLERVVEMLDPGSGVRPR